MLSEAGPVAVVVGLQHRTALSTVRSLAQMGIPVLGITSNPLSPLAKTRLCQKVCCPDVNGEPLVETLLELGKTFQEKAVLFASADPQVSLISENREILAPYYRMSLPSKEVVRLLLDKTQFAMFAEQHGFLSPKTIIVNGLADVQNCTKALLYPCILKPFNRTPLWKQHSPKSHGLWIHREGDLLTTVSKALEWTDRLILQEWIGGADSEIYFCLMYCDDNAEPRATFVGKKIRQWLPEIGSTASAEKKFDPTVLAESLRLFKTVSYKGLGSVEFKFDQRDQQFKIIEPTVGRPDLQSYVAVANGINIPHVAYSNLIGRPTSKLDHSSLAGAVKWINEWGEYQSGLFYRKRGDLTLKEWYASIRGPKTYALFSLSDPLPFMFMLKKAAIDTVKGGISSP